MDVIAEADRKTKYPNLYLAIIVLISCWLLFSLDYETTSFWVLLSPGNLAALLLYFLPTWVLSMLIYHKLKAKGHYESEFLLACLIGIPLGLGSVLSVFWLLS